MELKRRPPKRQKCEHNLGRYIFYKEIMEGTVKNSVESLEVWTALWKPGRTWVSGS